MSEEQVNKTYPKKKKYHRVLNEGKTIDRHYIAGGLTEKFNSYNYPVYCKSLELLDFHSSKCGIIQYKGIGIVMKIERGEKFDIITVRFGMTRRTRELLVFHNQARRQILTLKRGQCGIFSGEARLQEKMVKLYDDRPPVKRKWWVFHSYVNYGFYVPKAYDFKKHKEDVENGVEEEQIEKMQESREKHYDSVINDLFKSRTRDTVLEEEYEEIDDDFYKEIDEEWMSLITLSHYLMKWEKD